MYYNTRPKSVPKGVTIVCFHLEGMLELHWAESLQGLKFNSPLSTCFVVGVYANSLKHAYVKVTML